MLFFLLCFQVHLLLLILPHLIFDLLLHPLPTLAPLLLSPQAVVLPMPVLAPVTTTTLPSILARLATLGPRRHRRRSSSNRSRSSRRPSTPPTTAPARAPPARAMVHTGHPGAGSAVPPYIMYDHPPELSCYAYLVSYLPRPNWFDASLGALPGLPCDGEGKLGPIICLLSAFKQTLGLLKICI